MRKSTPVHRTKQDVRSSDTSAASMLLRKLKLRASNSVMTGEYVGWNHE